MKHVGGFTDTKPIYMPRDRGKFDAIIFIMFKTVKSILNSNVTGLLHNSSFMHLHLCILQTLVSEAIC